MENYFLFTHSVLAWVAGYLLAGIVFNLCLFGPCWKTRSNAPHEEAAAPVVFVARPIRKKRLTLPGRGRAALGIRKRLARQTY